MTTPPPAGRRDNGLPSAEWGALVDLDPRLSEALLSSLADAGVAAYVEPAGGQHAITRASQLPARPLDRLWVDPVRADAARAVVFAEVSDLTTLLAEQEPGATAHGLVQPVPRSGTHRVLTPPELPGPPVAPAPLAPDAPAPTASAAAPSTPAPSTPTPSDPGGGSAPTDPDAAWRAIVEGFDREADHPVPPWPVSEDVDAPRRPPASKPERSGELRRRTTDADDALPGWVEPEALDDEGHYEPPPPPPVPRLAPRKLAAVAGVLLGLALLFRPSLVGPFQLSPAGIFLVGLTLVLGGAATLVLLMRDAPPTDSGPDDGAVV